MKNNVSGNRFHLGANAVGIMSVLRRYKKGDTLKPEVLQQEGYDVKPGKIHYGSWQTATKRILKEDGLVWIWDRDNQCARCLTDEEIVKEQKKPVKRIRNISKNSMDKMDVVDKSKLSEFQRTKLNAYQSMQFLTHSMMKEKNVVQLASKVKNPHNVGWKETLHIMKYGRNDE